MISRDQHEQREIINYISMALSFNTILLTIFLTSFTLISAHPLDPLTPAELTQVRTIINGSHPHGSTQNLTFHYIGLDDPPKPTVLSWLSSSTQPTTTTTPPRRAFAVVRLDHRTHEFVVDLPTNSIVSDRVYHGFGYPSVTGDEAKAALTLPLTYAPFMASVSKRGLKLDNVRCLPFTVGWFGEKKVKSKRELKLVCFYTDGTVNMHVRPLEGITVIIDVDNMKIIKYYDRFTVPVPKADGTEYQASEIKPPFGRAANRVTVVQPDGPGVQIDGHIVRLVDIL